MATQTVDIEFRAKLANLKAELASIDGLTKKQTREIAGDWQRAWRSAEKSGTTALDKVSKEAGNLSKLGALVGGNVGAAIGNLGDVSELAADGMSGLAMAAVGVGAAVGAILAVGAAVTNILTNLDDYRETLDSLENRNIISPEQAEAVRRASAAITVITQYATDFAVVLTATVSPAILDFVKGTTYAFTFLQKFLGNTMVDLGQVFQTFGQVITTGWSRDAVGAFQGAVDELISIGGDWEDAQSEALQATRNLMADVGKEERRATAAYVASHREKVQETKDATAEVRAQLMAEAAAYDAARAAVFNYNVAVRESGATAVQATLDATTAAKIAGMAAAEEHARDLARVAELNDAKASADEQDRARKEAALAMAATQLNATSSLVSTIGQLYDQLTDNQIDNMRDGSEEQKKALKKQFAAHKAFALVTAGINTAAAVIGMLANPGGVAGIALAAVAAATGIAQIAIIAAQKPNFHVGGLVAPDEVDARLTATEGVLTSTGVASVGGEEGLRDLNRGRGPAPSGGGGMMALVVDGRLVDAMWTGVSRGRDGLMARVSAHMSGGMLGREPGYGT